MILVANRIEPQNMITSANAWSHKHSLSRTGIGSFLPVPDNLITQANQIHSIPNNAKTGSDIPKNLIVAPFCTANCPPIIGSNKDNIISATTVTDATIFGGNGNDIIYCGPGNCKVYGGKGNDFILGGASSNPQLYGGPGDDILIGGTGPGILVGGPGNNQLYSGPSGDYMVGGPGINYFDCGTAGNGIILDFDPARDTKASDCKYVFATSSH